MVKNCSKNNSLGRPPRPLEERFLSKVYKTDTCWLWLASVCRGYGQIRHDGLMIKAHRASYIIYKGPIPEGLAVRHMCHNKLCVNPEHLAVGTHQDNSWDKMESPKYISEIKA